MEIKGLYIFTNYRIIAFIPSEKGRYYHSLGTFSYGKGGTKYIDSDFENSRMENTSNYKILGLLSLLDDGKCLTIFKEAKYKGDTYPNFENPDGEKFNSPLESLKSYLRFEKWDLSKGIWISIPKPSSKLVGKKNVVEFDIVCESFERKLIKIELPVYTSDIKIDTKSINYGIELPDYLYDFLMLHPEIKKRPESKVIKTDIFSKLQGSLNHYNELAIELIQYDRESANAKKYIFIRFNSCQRDKKDEYQWGYAGKDTSINFQYFIGYSLQNSNNIFVNKRYENGSFVEIPKTQRKISVGNLSGFKRIEWTQEREDFLTKIETNFKQLSDNLNVYLSDLDSNKLDTLISSDIKLLS